MAWCLGFSLLFVSRADLALSIDGSSYSLSTVQELTLMPMASYNSSHDNCRDHDMPVVRIGGSLQMDCCSNFAKLGNDILQAWSLLIEYINGRLGGLLLNGSRHMVELTLLSDFSQKDLTEQNMRSLIKRGYTLLLAPYGSGQTEYAAKVVNETENAFLVAPGASKPTVFHQRPRVYGLLPRSPDYLQSAVQLAAESRPSHRHAAILWEDHGVAKAWASGLRQHLSSENFTTHQDSRISRNADVNNPGELEALVTNWIAEMDTLGVQPFLFAVTYSYETCTKLVKLFESVEFRVHVSAVFFTTCVDRGGFQADVGKAARFVSGVSPWADTLEVADFFTDQTAGDFMNSFKTKFSRDPGYVAAAAHGALATLCWAIQSAQSVDVELVRQQFEKLSSPDSALNTLYGSIYFDAHGQNAQSMRVLQWQGDDDHLHLVDVQSSTAFVLQMGACPSGQQFNNSMNMCELPVCPIGYEFSDALGKCSRCRSGMKRGIDDTQCVSCEAGTYSERMGMSDCSVCEPGTFSRAGRWFCDACMSGSFAQLPGQSACEPCAKGRWSNTAGSTECSACPGNLVTLVRGANSPVECICSRSKYLSCRPNGGSLDPCKVDFNISASFRCEDCQEGFDCRGGKEAIDGVDYHVQPELLSKFFASRDAPYEAYDCFEAGELCTGKGEEQCGGGRQGRQCYRCGYGHYAEIDGACHDCMDGKIVNLPIVILCIFPLLLLVNRATSKERSRYTARTALLGTMNQLVSFSQLYAILGSVSIAWVEPLKTIFGYLALLLFDIRILGPSCYFGDSTYTAVYVPGVMVPPTITFTMLTLWALSKVSRKHQLSWDNSVNTLGTVLLALYVGVCKPVFGIFECRTNASAPETVREHDGFICRSPEVMSTLPIAIFCIIVYVAGFICLYLYVILRAPKEFLASPSFRTKYRFMLSRWHPSSWYWGIFVLGRNVLCSLVPSMATDGILQLLLLIFFIYPVFVLQVRIWPWRDEIANKQDMVLTAALLLTIMGGITLQAKQLMDGVESVLVVLTVLSLSAGFVMSLLIVGHFSIAMMCNKPQFIFGRRSWNSSTSRSLSCHSSDQNGQQQIKLTTLLATIGRSSTLSDESSRVSSLTPKAAQNPTMEGSAIYETLQGIAMLREQYGDEQVAVLVNKFVAEVPENDLKRLRWFSDMLAYNLLGQDQRQPAGITLPSFVSRRPSWPPALAADDEQEKDTCQSSKTPSSSFEEDEEKCFAPSCTESCTAI